MSTPSDWIPPPRMLLGAAVSADENGNPMLTLDCDCATTTVTVFDGPLPTEPEEIAVTCDGCYSVRWITVVPTIVEDGDRG